MKKIVTKREMVFLAYQMWIWTSRNRKLTKLLRIWKVLQVSMFIFCCLFTVFFRKRAFSRVCALCKLSWQRKRFCDSCCACFKKLNWRFWWKLLRCRRAACLFFHSSCINNFQATSNVQSEPEPEESESSDSERETILLPDPEPESDEEPVQPPDEVKKELIPKISELERKFLKMLQENSKMASTIRISIPSSMRPRADMVFHLKIDFDENTVLVFCRNKYSQIAVKETSFQGENKCFYHFNVFKKFDLGMKL